MKQRQTRYRTFTVPPARHSAVVDGGNAETMVVYGGIIGPQHGRDSRLAADFKVVCTHRPDASTANEENLGFPLARHSASVIRLWLAWKLFQGFAAYFISIPHVPALPPQPLPCRRLAIATSFAF